VRAATLAWSNGPAEGQINRLQTIKRQMYGRASLELLGRRFLLAVCPSRVAKSPNPSSNQRCLRARAPMKVPSRLWWK